MKKFYIIAPIVLLAIFGYAYVGFTKEYAVTKEVKAAKAEADAQAAAAVKKEAEIKAKEDAARRTAEREAEDARKIAERRAKWEAEGQEIADAKTRYSQAADKFSKEAAELEIKLLEVRRKREQLAGEAFALTKSVELARIEKRTAELKIQRWTDMLSKRAQDSLLAKMPPPPSLPTK